MRRLILLLLLLAGPLSAAPKVASTIAPLNGLVAAIMQDVGEPAALVPSNQDPHGFSLRPSQISALGEADIVFAVGLGLEPWLARVAGDFITVNLADVASEALPARNFDLSARDDFDPHLWLDPGEMIPWELEITQRLIALDPENTAQYRANEFALLKTLVAAKERLEAIGARLNAANIRLIPSHDAYQYLERRLGVPSLGMLSDIAGTRAGARSLSRLGRLEGPVCLLESPEALAPASLLPQAPRARIDLNGSEIAGEPDFIARYYQNIAGALENCLAAG